MASPLRSTDPDLRDLARDAPLLIEATRGKPTGVTLLDCLGVGGMSSVFLAELDPEGRSDDLSPLTPRRLVIKIMKPRTIHELEMAGLAQEATFEREVTSLRRMMERRPPTEFVVGFYGRGFADVSTGQREERLPWIALELAVDVAPPVTFALIDLLGAGDEIIPFELNQLAVRVPPIVGVGLLHEADESLVAQRLTPRLTAALLSPGAMPCFEEHAGHASLVHDQATADAAWLDRLHETRVLTWLRLGSSTWRACRG